MVHLLELLSSLCCGAFWKCGWTRAFVRIDNRWNHNANSWCTFWQTILQVWIEKCLVLLWNIACDTSLPVYIPWFQLERHIWDYLVYHMASHFQCWMGVSINFTYGNCKRAFLQSKKAWLNGYPKKCIHICCEYIRLRILSHSILFHQEVGSIVQNTIFDLHRSWSLCFIVLRLQCTWTISIKESINRGRKLQEGPR